MATNKLTATEVAKLIKDNKQGRHGDGGGLYLEIKGGSASWIFRFIRQGRERQMGLGPARDVSLAQAREKAQAHRTALANDSDPQLERDRERASKNPTTVTFQIAAEQFLDNYRRGLKNEKHRAQVGTRLETYAFPVLGRMAVNRIETSDVEKALEATWHEKPETASRVRSLIERVLNYAKVKGWRKGENPAAWKNNLEFVFARVGTLREIRHHPALDYAELPAFMGELRYQNGVAARALEFLILTNCRTADIIGVTEKDDDGEKRGRPDKPPLRWTDINWNENTWTIPKSKASAPGVGHKKPLTPRCMEILREMKRLKLDNVIVFPSVDKPGHALSAAAMRGVVREAMERPDLSVHGFRATFKTWAGEETPTPREVVEASMAHGIISDKVEAAYRRADFFSKRRTLMDAWAKYAGPTKGPGGKVIEFYGARR